MKSPALVAVEQSPSAFAALFDAARARKVRIGWLDLASAASPPSPALAAGAAKSVAVESGRVVAAKRVAGAAVLRDLLREHFVGFGVVLVAGGDGWPRLSADGDRLTLSEMSSAARALAGDDLLDELLRPKRRAR